MNEKYYIISESRLKELLETELYAEALNWEGVDNWSWYGEAMESYRQAKDELTLDEYRTYEEGIL